MKEALKQKEMETLCAVAHKMLPTFTMIEAHEVLPSLQFLEKQKGEKKLSEEADTHARKIIKMAEEMIQETKENKTISTP